MDYSIDSDWERIMALLEICVVIYWCFSKFFLFDYNLFAVKIDNEL